MATNPFNLVHKYVIYGNDVTVIVTILGQQSQHRTSDLLAHPNVTAGFHQAVRSSQEEESLPHYNGQGNLERQPGAMSVPDGQGNEWAAGGIKIPQKND